MIIEEFRHVRANKHRERDLHIRIKEMHTHIRETELKEEEKEEELKQCEESLKKQEEELRIWEEQLEKRKKICYIILLHAVGSTLCVVISINMCCIPIYFMYCILNFYAIVFYSLSIKLSLKLWC
jgi:hypothetical protein